MKSLSVAALVAALFAGTALVAHAEDAPAAKDAIQAPAQEAPPPAASEPSEVSAADQEAFAKRVFGGKIDKDKAVACFVRRYDTAHLARHPEQKVRAMKLLVTAEVDSESKSLGYSFSLDVSLRHRAGHFRSGGTCGHPLSSQISADKLQLGCGVDCDGGGLSVELTGGDRAVLVRIEEISIWSENGDRETGQRLAGGSDDRMFRLDRASLADCRSLNVADAPAAEKVAAADRE